MKEAFDELCRTGLFGHGLWINLSQNSTRRWSPEQLFTLAERKKRGVKFLPDQVIRRAIRKSQTKAGTSLSSNMASPHHG